MLSKVVVIGLAGMLLSGAAAVALADERIRQLRALVIRVGISAISFAVIIRIGGWAVDPEGGRSPIAAGGAVLLRSNGHVLAAVALGTAVVAAGMSIFLLRRRRSQPATPEPVDPSETTGEQPVLVGAGMR